MFDKEYYIKKGMEAAKAYLLDKTPMNDNIAKMAMADKMTPEQADRVAEFANHFVVASLYKKATDSRYIQFDVADKKAIRQKIAEIAVPFHKSAGLSESQRMAADEYITIHDLLQLKLAMEKTLREYFSDKKKYAAEVDADELKLKDKLEDVYAAVRSSILNGEPWPDIKKVLEENIGPQNTAIVENNLMSEGLVTEKPDIHANELVDTTAIDGNSNEMIRLAAYKTASNSLYGKLVKLAYINNKIAETSEMLTGIDSLYQSLSKLADAAAMHGYGVTIKVAAFGGIKIKVPKILKKEPKVEEALGEVRKSVKLPGVKKITKLLGGNSLYMAMETIPAITKKYVAFF